ncbi:hypothetical protein [Bacillus sp. REN3]|nr:hypothetical protein [Bacillus sp. REN3]
MAKDRKDQTAKSEEARLYGLDEETCLQSVNFAGAETHLLNERNQDEE